MLRHFLGLQLEQVRAETLQVLRQHQQGQKEEPIIAVPPEAVTLLAEGEPGLTCIVCEAHCPGYFRYCFNCGQALIQEER